MDSRSTRGSVAPLPVEQALADLERIPRVLEQFELADELGRGGMGVVHRGSDRRLGRSVAIKLLGQDVAAQQQLIRRFAIEAQLGAQLEHPNIVPFYALVATAEGTPGFVMRLVEGETLGAYLASCAKSAQAARTAPHDLTSRLERFLKVCDAIEYAHARDVIHRDLKPENVMLGVHNEVYVMDWGVAHVATRSEAPGPPSRPAEPSTPAGPANLTRSGDVIGSPSYMAPEQARGETITFASDQYALGLILAEIATLRPVRSGSAVQQLSEAILAKPVDLAHEFGERIGRELAAIVRRATAALAADRYPSVAALAADVRAYVRDEAVLAAPDPAWVTAWRWLKRRPSVVLGVVLALVLAISATVVVNLRRELETRARAARHAERIAALTAAVGHTARAIDTRFHRIELLVEALGTEAASILERPPRLHAEVPEPAELRPTGTGAEPIERYGQRVTFDRAVHVRSAGADAAALAPVTQRAGDFERILTQISARAADGDAVSARSIAEQRSAARARSPILWTDLAFAGGELFVYPGNTFFPADYDVRKRPWYIGAADRRGEVWGAPYPDATNGRLLVACARAFHDPAGALLGVAAAHVRLDDVLDALAIPVAGFQWAALVDGHGDIVLSTKERSALSQGSTALEAFPFPAVRTAIAARTRDGFSDDGAALVVFQQIATNGWSLAAVLASSTYSIAQ